MHKLDIKPLSVNQAWRGRRYKTEKYNNYVWSVCSRLPKNIVLPSNQELKIMLRFGQSSKGADFDNPVKPFVDCLQKKYKFNDNRIKQALINVDHVPKGQEYIEFMIAEQDKHEPELYIKALMLKLGKLQLELSAQDIEYAKHCVLHCDYTDKVTLSCMLPVIDTKA